MGQSLVDMTLELLRSHGIRADLAQPGSRMPVLTESVAAVSLDSVRTLENQASVVVTVLTPKYLGAAACEAEAIRVSDALQTLTDDRKVAGCRFEKGTELFSVAVTAVCTGRASSDGWILPAKLTVKLGSTVLAYPTSFTAWRETDDTVTQLEDAYWHFRLEEYFPTEIWEELEPEEPFMLRFIGPHQSETYMNCSWTLCRRKLDNGGIRQIREGQAQTRMVAQYQ